LRHSSQGYGTLAQLGQLADDAHRPIGVFSLRAVEAL